MGAMNLELYYGNSYGNPFASKTGSQTAITFHMFGRLCSLQIWFLVIVPQAEGCAEKVWIWEQKYIMKNTTAHVVAKWKRNFQKSKRSIQCPWYEYI